MLFKSEFKRFLKALGQKGMSMAEVMVATGAAAGLSLVLAQLSKNAANDQARISAKNDFEVMTGQINTTLGNPTSCGNTTSGMNAAAITAMASANGYALTQIRDKIGGVVFQTTAPATRLGKATVQSLVLKNYNAAADTANLEITATYTVNSKSVTTKKKIIPINIDATGAAVTYCAAGSNADVGPWEKMSIPALGIYYNQGSVLVGSGTANTGGATPSFALGTGNNTTAQNSAVFGSNNTIGAGDTNGFVAGQSNTVGSWGQAAWAIGNNNQAHGHNTGALGVNNTVQAGNGSLAMGGANTISGSYYGSMALGWNNTINIPNNGPGVDDSYSVAIGSYNNITRGGVVSMSDRSSTTPLTPSGINSFNGRFAGGYNFYTDATMTALNSVKFHANGKVTIGNDQAPLSTLAVGPHAGYSTATGHFYKIGSGTSVALEGQVLPSGDNQSQIGVAGLCSGPNVSSYCKGVIGFGGYSAAGGGRSYGVQGQAQNGTAGYNYGIYGQISGTNGGSAVFGTIAGDVDTGATKWAGYFNGPVRANHTASATDLVDATNIKSMFRLGYIPYDDGSNIQQSAIRIDPIVNNAYGDATYAYYASASTTYGGRNIATTATTNYQTSWAHSSHSVGVSGGATQGNADTRDQRAIGVQGIASATTAVTNWTGTYADSYGILRGVHAGISGVVNANPTIYTDAATITHAPAAALYAADTTTGTYGGGVGNVYAGYFHGKVKITKGIQQDGWIDVTMSASATSGSGSWMKCRIDSVGNVHIKGYVNKAATTSSSSQTTMGTLPLECRPRAEDGVSGAWAATGTGYALDKATGAKRCFHIPGVPGDGYWDGRLQPTSCSDAEASPAFGGSFSQGAWWWAAQTIYIPEIIFSKLQ